MLARIVDALKESKPLFARASMVSSLGVVVISVSIMLVDMDIGILCFLNGAALALNAMSLKR